MQTSIDAKCHYNFWRPITAIRNGDVLWLVGSGVDSGRAHNPKVAGSSPCNYRKDADSRTAENVSPIPSFPGKLPLGFLACSQISALWCWLNENSWDSERQGCKSRAHFSAGGAGVESTAPNFVRPLRKRVADANTGSNPVQHASASPSKVISSRLACLPSPVRDS